MGLLGPFSGAIGDRFNRRRVMIVCDSGAAVRWLVAAGFADSPGLLLAIAFISSIVESPFFPAASAAIPNIAGQEHISWANSLVSIGPYAGVAIGPLVGGLLVAAAGARWMFVTNAGTAPRLVDSFGVPPVPLSRIAGPHATSNLLARSISYSTGACIPSAL